MAAVAEYVDAMVTTRDIVCDGAGWTPVNMSCRVRETVCADTWRGDIPVTYSQRLVKRYTSLRPKSLPAANINLALRSQTRREPGPVREFRVKR